MQVAAAESRGRGIVLAPAVAPRQRAAMTIDDGGAPAAPSDFVGLLQAVVARRDQAAFMVLFDYYAPRIKAYLRRLGAGDGLAEDLAQEAMLAVWRKAESYDPAKASVGTWIYTIARNLRIDALRRERRPELEPDDPRLVPEPEPPPDRQMEQRSQAERVRSALRALPEDQAQVVTMAFYGGKSQGEIAAELALPLGTVKSRMRLAFRRVRGLLGDVR